MKRRWIITLVLAVLTVAAVVAARQWPRTVPADECSEVYRRYAGRPGLSVSYIKDFRCADTLTVDVTLLQAADTARWDHLMDELGIDDDLAAAQRQAGGFIVYSAPVGDPTRSVPRQLPGTELVVVSFAPQAVTVYHTTTNAQTDAILNNELHKLTDPHTDEH